MARATKATKTKATRRRATKKTAKRAGKPKQPAKPSAAKRVAAAMAEHAAGDNGPIIDALTSEDYDIRTKAGLALLAQLEAPELRTRDRALQMLAYHWDQADEEVPMEAFDRVFAWAHKHPDDFTRDIVGFAGQFLKKVCMLELGLEDQDGVRTLHRMLAAYLAADPSPIVRELVLDVFVGREGRLRRFVPTLIKMTEDPVLAVRRAAYRRLTATLAPNELLEPVFAKGRHDPDDDIRSTSLRGLDVLAQRADQLAALRARAPLVEVPHATRSRDLVPGNFITVGGEAYTVYDVKPAANGLLAVTFFTELGTLVTFTREPDEAIEHA